MNKKVIILTMIWVMGFSGILFASNEFEKNKQSWGREILSDINKLDMMITHNTHLRETLPFPNDFKRVLIRHTVSCSQRKAYLQESLLRINAALTENEFAVIQNEILATNSVNNEIEDSANKIGVEFIKFACAYKKA